MTTEPHGPGLFIDTAKAARVLVGLAPGDDAVEHLAEYINGYMSGEYGEDPAWPMEACRKLAAGIAEELALWSSQPACG